MSKRVTAEQLAESAWKAALVAPTIEAEEVPDGWKTAIQLAQMTGRERSTITNRMSLLVRQGKAEMKRFRVMTGRGVYPTPHYRLLK